MLNLPYFKMKYCFLIFSLLVSLKAKSQHEENTEICNQNTEQNNYYFPNTNIGKSSLAFYFGVGVPHITKNLTGYYKPNLNLTMSLDYYHDNNLAFSLLLMMADGHLKKDVNINNKIWTPKDTLTFTTYGLSIGYSILNKVHWRINPLSGIVLSQSKLTSQEDNKYKIGVKPSPVVGINFSYRFINVKKAMQRSKYSGSSNCFGINARVAYVPFVVNKKNAPFSGGIWFMTIGITPINLY